MKVLRTALFSTFLTICFMNVGHTQTVEIPEGITPPKNGWGTNSPTNVEVEILDATAVAIPNSQYVVVNYNTTTSSNSTAEIRLEDDTNVLYTQGVPGSGSMTAVVIMDSTDNVGKHLECEVCDAASNCAMRKCIVVIDVNGTGGGGN